MSLSYTGVTIGSIAKAAQLSQVLDLLTGVMLDQGVQFANGLSLTGTGTFSGYMDMKWQTTPSAPSGSASRLYFKSDGSLYGRGTGFPETLIGPGGASSNAVIFQNATDYGKKWQRVASGSISCTGATNVTNLYQGTATLNFPSTFSSTPTAQVTGVPDSATGFWGGEYSNISTTQIVVYVYGDSNGRSGVAQTWAVG